MLGLFKKRKKKVVIIGIDGAPFSLFDTYIKDGLMPEFSKMSYEGKLFKMNSSLPEVSSVAWTSFMTGENPGRHGIFGFMEIDRNNYEYIFPNFKSIKSDLFWESLKLPTVAFNIPQTYPARPINGVIVSGFVALDLKQAVYPERIYDYLKSIGYRLDVDTNLAKENPDLFFKNLFETFERRKEAVRHLYKTEDWQIFIGTITETDRLHHFFFDSAYSGEYHHIFKEFYSSLDQFLGEIYRMAKDDGALFMTCSDHGFTETKSEVYINRWLMENGFLKLGDETKLASIKPDSSVFCLDPSRIYIHLKGSYSRGSVERADYHKIRDEISGGLKEVSYNGEKIIEGIYLREEIFNGPSAESGPDIYFLPRYGFDLKASLGNSMLFGKTHLKGMHTYDDAHLFISEKAYMDNEDIDISGVASVVKNYFFGK